MLQHTSGGQEMQVRRAPVATEEAVAAEGGTPDQELVHVLVQLLLPPATIQVVSEPAQTQHTSWALPMPSSHLVSAI